MKIIVFKFYSLKTLFKLFSKMSQRHHLHDFMDTDEIDPETLQQIIDMEDRQKNIELDYLLAQQMITDNSNCEVDDDMSSIMEQILHMEEHQKKRVKEQEINEARSLREEQDREYEESLLLDMQKEHEKQKQQSPIIEDVTEEDIIEDNSENVTTHVEPIVEEPKSLTPAELRAMRLKHFTK